MLFKQKILLRKLCQMLINIDKIGINLMIRLKTTRETTAESVSTATVFSVWPHLHSRTHLAIQWKNFRFFFHFNEMMMMCSKYQKCAVFMFFLFFSEFWFSFGNIHWLCRDHKDININEHHPVENRALGLLMVYEKKLDTESKIHLSKL